MKRTNLRLFMIAGMLALLPVLAACGAEEETKAPEADLPAVEAPVEQEIVTEPQPEPQTPEYEAFFAEYQGEMLKPGEFFNGGSFAMAQPPEETPDCRTGRTATVYDFGDLNVQTVTDSNLETGETGLPYISSVVFRGEAPRTGEGIDLGSSREDVLRVYGTDYEDQFGACVWTAGITKLRVTFDESGAVSYLAITLDENLFDSAAFFVSEEEYAGYMGWYPSDETYGITFTGLEPMYYGYREYKDSKGEGIDYLEGVKAFDKYGYEIENLEYSLFVPSVMEAYYYTTGYVVITAADSYGNTATGLKPFYVEDHTERDDETIAKWAEKAGSDPLEAKQWVKAIPYFESWQAPDPFSHNDGNCYWHTRVLQEILRYHGYETMLAWSCPSSRHFWLMVKLTDEETGETFWRHLDPTPLSYYQDKYTGYMTDDQRQDMLNYEWDRDFWPKAE